VAAGRLDKWASGLLVMSQDGTDSQYHLQFKGQLVHQLTTPKRRSGVSGKVYEVKLHKPLVGNEPKIFASGDLKLKSETKPCKPALLEVV
jgi:16S rRNA pseudouridine516 synthase